MSTDTLGVVDLFHQLAQNGFGFFQKIKSVADLMTPQVQTLTLDDTYENAVSLFNRRGIHHAPVVDKGEVVGIVSDRDILRHRPPLLGTAMEGDEDHKALQVCVSQFMTRSPAAVATHATPEAALTVMLDQHIDSVLVHNEDKVLQGIITPRDFMKMVLLFHRVCTATPDLVRFRLVDLDMSRGLPLDLVFSRGARSVRDVMTKEVTALTVSDKVETAIQLMQSLEVRHIPVVNESRQVIGMVSDRDLLRFLPLPVPRAKPGEPQGGFRDRLFATLDRKVLTERISVVMTSKPTTVRPDTLLIEAITVLQEQTISGLPVIDAESNELCGILTSADILRVFRVIMQIGSIVVSPK